MGGRQLTSKQIITNYNTFSRGNEAGAVDKNREAEEELIILFEGIACSEVKKT